MTIEEEEKFIADQLAHARHELEIYEKAARAAKWKVDQQKAALETLKQAAFDYMTGNGLIECEAFKLRKSYRVDVENIEAVPPEYLRVKTITEINKEKIRAERPVGNWWILSEHISVEVK